jgi:hypothetical protein
VSLSTERPVGPRGRQQAGGGSQPTGEAAAAGTRGGALPLRVLAGLSRLFARVPRAAWGCALVATLSAVGWSFVTPPFQAPDEPSHFAYVQYLAEAGALPTSNSATFSAQEQVVLLDLEAAKVRWHPEVKAIHSPLAVAKLRADLSGPLPRRGPGGAGVAASEPPLYYALETIPYELGAGGTMLDQLELMRLLSALMAGLTALFVFMFVREALPGSSWAWTVGGLAAALTPVLGFTSGVVTPDALLYAVSAAVFYGLARAFRRGLTRRLALATGGAVALGFLTKVNFVGLAPGVVLALAILGFRPARSAPGEPASKHAFGPMGLALLIAVSPVLLYAFHNLLVGKPALGIVSSAIHLTAGHESLGSDLVYAWEFYLPRLPGMANYFQGLSVPRDMWFDRTVGLYGWLDTSFPSWVATLALIPAGSLALLCAGSLIARRDALLKRRSELVAYTTMSLGLMALLAQDSHLHRSTEGVGYFQPRYLLPLLPLAAVAAALAARGAGRRWGPALGALIVVLLLAQDLFSQLQVVARFYG